MRGRFFDLAFTPGVKAEQARHGSRGMYAAAQDAADDDDDTLDDRTRAFLAARDSFYLASISETGWPYVQHRGGPPGFVRVLDDRTLGWAEFAGNRQYVSAGNAAANDRVALIFVDYPNRRRLKVLGHLRVHQPGERPDLEPLVMTDGYRAKVEGVVTVTVEAYDWNCPQHITPRYTLAEIEAATAPLRARLAELEARLAERPEPPAPIP